VGQHPEGGAHILDGAAGSGDGCAARAVWGVTRAPGSHTSGPRKFSSAAHGRGIGAAATRKGRRVLISGEDKIHVSGFSSSQRKELRTRLSEFAAELAAKFQQPPEAVLQEIRYWRQSSDVPSLEARHTWPALARKHGAGAPRRRLSRAPSRCTSGIVHRWVPACEEEIGS
jgi:hypothetical protein